MTDRPDDVLDDPLDDPLDDRESEVRRLLEDARHEEPVPTDVAARLDRVLAQLAAGDGAGPSAVTALAVRRRRRVAGLLAAAAAVAVVGVGLGQVVPWGTGGGADSSESAGGAVSGQMDQFSAADRDEAQDGASANQDGVDSPTPEASALSGGSVAAESPTDRATLAHPSGPLVRVRADRFPTDALRARHRLDAGRTENRHDHGLDCAPADWGPGTAVAVRYGGQPHVLVFRAPAGDTQVVDLLRCGTGEILRSTTLPAD